MDRRQARRQKAINEYHEMKISLLSRSPDTYSVKHNEREHTVDMDNRICSCHDYKIRRVKCKHIWRVEMEVGTVRDNSQQDSTKEVKEYDWKPVDLIWF